MTAQPRVIAIGDVHGSAAALDALLTALAPAADDVVITLGDYVDRGVDSAGVIERLIGLSAACQLVPLRGNHEEMMMDARVPRLRPRRIGPQSAARSATPATPRSASRFCGHRSGGGKTNGNADGRTGAIVGSIEDKSTRCGKSNPVHFLNRPFVSVCRCGAEQVDDCS